MNSVETRVAELTRLIKEDCIRCGLNLTVYEGKIGFVDQEQKKIVALWNPQYTADDISGGKRYGI